VPIEHEVGIVDPHRSAAAERNAPQPLTQPGNRRHSFGQEGPYGGQRWTPRRAELQDGADVHGTEPWSVAKTVRSIGPIRSIRRPPNRSAVSTITLPLIPEKVRPNRWGVPKRRSDERNGFDLLDARPPLLATRRCHPALPGPMCAAVAVLASSARASARRVDGPGDAPAFPG
jgi:hypothetical protein